MNTWCNANSVSFKCHSISVTFKFCAVLVALCTPEPRSTDSLGTQHCANFESHSNRVTFETNAISITSSIHAHIGFNRAISPRFLAKWKNLHLCLDEMLPSMKDLKMTFEYLDFAIALFNKTLRTLSYFGLGYE